MKICFRNTLALLISLLLAACASTPKVALTSEVKQSIKRIALIQIHEPEKYFLNPGQAPGGAALYMFGALGGAILGSIEVSRFNTATTQFNSAVSPLKSDLSDTLISQLESGLRNKGYEIVRVPPPPMTADGKRFDFSKIEGQFDAILSSGLTAGYRVDSGMVSPQVTVAILLLSSPKTDTLFEDTYTYSSRQIGKSVWIEPDIKFTNASTDALYDHINNTVDGLRTGTAKLAERIVADL